MTRPILTSILFILCLKNIKSARILAVFPTPSISHQVVFRPLVHELARRGHDVTVVTTDPAFPPGQNPGNLTEIDVHDLSYTVWKEEIIKGSVFKKNDVSTQTAKYFRTILKITMDQIETKEIQHIITKKKGEFDLLFLEAYVQPALIYSHFFKVPVILISSFDGSKYNFGTVGAPTHPFLYPTKLHQKLYNLTNWEKLQQLYKDFCVDNTVKQVELETDTLLKLKFGSDSPTLHELSNNVQMLFVNVNPIWIDNQPVPTNVVYIGGIHVTPRKELPEDLQTYLDSSKNGVIYFSLGTNVRPSSLPPETIQIFIKVFSELHYDILWKWDEDVLPGITENIKIFQWLPQSDVLRHPNVKLFITQGGLQSTDEAISAGVPLIGIPLLADQWYRENIIRLRTLMMDQPQSPLERAVWWTEHVLRHGGARHLRARGANITWTEYLELELVLIVILTILCLSAILSISLYMTWKLIRGNFNTKTKRKNA